MDKHLRRAKWLVSLLDNKFSIFGYRFGLDPLLGLIPGGGDLISLMLAIYLLWNAQRVGVSPDKMFIMIKNVFIDLLIGAVPIVGDVGDFIFKSNQKNWEIIEKHISDSNVIEGEVVEDK